MKILAFFMIFLGFISFWSFRPDSSGREMAQSEAVALNYALFRNAVFEYAQREKTSGSVFPGDPGLVALPTGWVNIRPWQGLIQHESDGQMYCYVFGPAQPEEVAAVQKLFHQSMTVGWNSAGVFIRNGHPIPLPAAIPPGALVSVIRLD